MEMYQQEEYLLARYQNLFKLIIIDSLKYYLLYLLHSFCYSCCFYQLLYIQKVRLLIFYKLIYSFIVLYFYFYLCYFYHFQMQSDTNERSDKEINQQKYNLVHEYRGIKLPLLQMTDPYYPHSLLAKSKFSGYYVLFFMFSIFFTITYPFLNFLSGKDLFELTIIKLVQTNILWDLVSIFLFIFLALIMTQICLVLNKVSRTSLMVSTYVIFISCGIYIVKSYQMYFTDRIFIVVLNWGICAKTLSYIYDKRSQKQGLEETKAWSIEQKKKNMEKIFKKLLFFISPYPIYHKFVEEYDPTLPIHAKYLLSKLFVSFLCLLVNNILIVQFIEPACNNDLSLIALTFKLVPLTFYINMTLYYMVMDNIIAALAQTTRVRNRIFYLDWWNAQTVYEFLEKWCLIIGMSTQGIIKPKLKDNVRHTLHVSMLLFLLLQVFGKSINLLTIFGFIFIISTVYFLGGEKKVQNNVLVHILCMFFTPFLIALEVKYQVFSN